MNEEKNNIEDNRKIWYALSAIMFFAPFIKYNLKTDKTLSQWDKLFIHWFIKFWYLNILLLISVLLLYIAYVYTKNPIFQTAKTYILILIAWLLLIESILAIFKKNINLTNTEWKADYNKIFAFIPLYNIYLWYKNHDFDWENVTTKFGIFLRSIFSIVLIVFHNKYISIIWSILILISIISAVVWISFWNNLKKIINNLFKKNPEEIRWYIAWPVLAIIKHKWMKESIDEKKLYFSFLFKIEDKQILLEYIILSLIIILLIIVWLVHKNHQILVWVTYIVLRYLIMILKRKHLPHIPLIGEITNVCFKNKQLKNE